MTRRWWLRPVLCDITALPMAHSLSRDSGAPSTRSAGLGEISTVDARVQPQCFGYLAAETLRLTSPLLLHQNLRSLILLAEVADNTLFPPNDVELPALYRRSSAKDLIEVRLLSFGTIAGCLLR